MGQAKSSSMRTIFNVGSESEFKAKVTLFLEKEFVPILPIEARELIQQPKFQDLFELLIDYLQHENCKVVQSTLKLLRVFIPILLVEDYKLLVSNNPKVEVEQKGRITIVKADEDVEPLEAASLAQPRIFRIMENLVNLLFRPNFTIQGTDTFNLALDHRLTGLLKQWLDKQITVKLQHIWRGLATLTKYPNDQKQYYENRVLVLSCILACLQEKLYHQEMTALPYLAFEDHAELFASLWAVILFHKHGYFWFQDNALIQQKTCRYMAILSAQILNIIFAHDKPENKFRKTVIETNLLDYSFDLLIENIQQSLISDSNLITTKVHDNKGVQEFMGLLYFLLKKNQYAHEFMQQLKSDQIRTFLQLLLYYIAQFMDDEVNYEVYSITLELLEFVLKYETFLKISQEGMKVQYRVKVLPITSGTYQDLIVSYLSHLLLLDFTSRSQYMIDKFKKKLDKVEPVLNYRSGAIARTLYRLSSATKTLNEDAASLFDQAFKKYFIYEFVFQHPQLMFIQNLLIGVELNFIRNGCNHSLYYLLQDYVKIAKFSITDKKLLKYISSLDSEQGNQKQYLSLWKSINFKPCLPNIQELLAYATSLPFHTLNSTEFATLYQQSSWNFIREVFIELHDVEFEFERYGYLQFKQQLEHMPLIDIEKCNYS